MYSPGSPQGHTRDNQADSSNEDSYSIHLTNPSVSGRDSRSAETPQQGMIISGQSCSGNIHYPFARQTSPSFPEYETLSWLVDM
jgi:hypothetical protein